MPEKSVTDSAIEAAANLLPQAYDDLLKPASIELGKSLETVAKSVNLALSPVSGLIWGFEQIKEYFSSEVASRLLERDAEQIQAPLPSVAVPAIEALRYLHSEQELRDLFTNLLVSALDSTTADQIHPAFVEVIKQLSAEEAILLGSLKSFNKYYPLVCEAEYDDGDDFHNVHTMMSETYKEFSKAGDHAGLKEGLNRDHLLDNLLRLRLLEVRESGDVELERVEPGDWKDPAPYDKLNRTRFEALYVTKFGEHFIDICVDKNVEQGSAHQSTTRSESKFE